MDSEDSRPELNEAWKTWYDLKSGRESEKGYYAIEEMSKSEEPEVRCKCERLCRFLENQCKNFFYNVKENPDIYSDFIKGNAETFAPKGKDELNYYFEMFKELELNYLPKISLEEKIRKKCNKQYPYFCMGCDICQDFISHSYGLRVFKGTKVKAVGGKKNNDIMVSLDSPGCNGGRDNSDHDDLGSAQQDVPFAPEQTESLDKEDCKRIAKVFWKDFCSDSFLFGHFRLKNMISPEDIHAEMERRRAVFYANIHGLKKSEPKLLELTDISASTFYRWRGEMRNFILRYFRKVDRVGWEPESINVDFFGICLRDYSTIWTDRSELGQKVKAFMDSKAAEPLRYKEILKIKTERKIEL